MALIEEFQFGQPRSTGENHLRLKLIAERNYLKEMEHNFWNSIDAKKGLAL